MDDNYLIDFNSFEEYRNYFIKKIDEFKDSVSRIHEACTKLEWEGDGYTSTMNLVSKQLNDLDNVISIMDLYKRFMDVALNNYSDGVEEIKKDFEKIINEIKEEKARRGELEDGTI